MNFQAEHVHCELPKRPEFHSPSISLLVKYELTQENISTLRSFLSPSVQESIAWPASLCEMLDKLLLMLPQTWQYELKKLKLLKVAHGLVKTKSKASLEQSIQEYKRHYQTVTLGRHHHLTSSFRPKASWMFLESHGLPSEKAEDIARFLQEEEDIEGFLGHFLTLVSSARNRGDGEPGKKSSNVQLRQLERLARSVEYARLNHLPLEHLDCITAASKLGVIRNHIGANR